VGITGLPLILSVAFGTLAAVAATVLVWNRFGRVRYLLRAGGVLLAEVLLLLSFGLAVNRSEQFYPTWDSLLNSKTDIKITNDNTYRSTPGALDRSLAVRAGGHAADAQTFPWQSAGWRGWGLSAAPIVITPPGYLLHPAWSYSAVVVIGGWSATVEESAARRATATGLSAVVVFATTTATTTAAELATGLPGQLDRDLRVTTHRWAMVAADADAALAESAVDDAALRYPSIAVDRAAALPAGVTAAAVVTGNDPLYSALSWAIARTPPPLASPQPSPRRCGCHRTAKR
jgi:hypothetical protein